MGILRGLLGAGEFICLVQASMRAEFCHLSSGRAREAVVDPLLVSGLSAQQQRELRRLECISKTAFDRHNIHTHCAC